MVNLSISGDSIVFEFINSNYYLQNGKIATPINSLALITDESNIATFKKASSNDIFVAATYDELGKSKNELIEWFKDNAVGATGGGDLDDYYTKEETDDLIEESVSGKADSSAVTEAISEAVSGKTDLSAFTAYTSATDTALQGKASQSDLNTVSGAVDTKASNTDLQALESVVGGKLNTSDFNSYSGAIDTALQGKTDVSAFTAYTSATETVLGNKADSSALTAYFDGVEYNSVNKTIEFYNGNVLKDSIDATDFIKDGMVDNVSISGGNLVITFNTDAGKENIEIPLTDIFNPNNYYDKTATDGLLDAKVDVSAYTAYTSSTETALNGKASQTDLNTVSGNVDTLSGDMTNKVDVSAYTAYTSATDTALQGKADTSDLANYVEVTAYTAYTSATDTALSGKASQTDLNTVSGDVATVSGSVANKQDLLVSGTNIKTVNGNSLLGSGNITIESGQTVTSVTQAEYDDLVTKDADTFYIISDATGSTITIDPSLDSGSTNAVANSAITIAIDAKASQTDLNTVSAATSANTTALSGYSLWKGTQVQYDAILTKDEDTIYFIVNNS